MSRRRVGRDLLLLAGGALTGQLLFHVINGGPMSARHATVLAVALVLAGLTTIGWLLRQRSGDATFDAHTATAMALLDCDPVGPAREWADLTAAEEDVFAEIAGKHPELGGAV